MQYSTTFLDYFLNTAHAEKPSGHNIICIEHVGVGLFDSLSLYIKLNNGVIKEARFEASTTPVLIAAGEYICRWLEGKSIEEAISLQKDQILQELDIDARFIYVAALIERLVSQLKGQGHGTGSGSEEGTLD